MDNRLGRREFNRLLAALLGTISLSMASACRFFPLGKATRALGDGTGLNITPLPMEADEGITLGTDQTEVTDPTDTEEAPEIEIVPADFGPRVVHVHAPSAVSWTGDDPQYWNYIDQTVVDKMVDQGVMTLTGATSVADAWRVILPNYQPGQGIAIKVSFNNCFTCGNPGTAIDGVIEPVNAVVRGLLQIGVLESDIWIYDAIRALPDRFVNRCLYSNVQFFDNGCHTSAGWSSNDPDAYVTFNPPKGVPAPAPTRVADVLINAKYLINMPIMKRHEDEIGVSLAFKNHFGSIMNPGDLHEYIISDSSYYRTDYSALIDLYRNPHIGAKTMLTIGDGLFASKMYSDPPSLWTSFGGEAPSSLFFSTDPVAIDCVMTDLLAAELSMPKHADDYLNVADSVGLGVYERRDSEIGGYRDIIYQKIES